MLSIQFDKLFNIGYKINKLMIQLAIDHCEMLFQRWIQDLDFATIQALHEMITYPYKYLNKQLDHELVKALYYFDWDTFIRLSIKDAFLYTQNQAWCNLEVIHQIIYGKALFCKSMEYLVVIVFILYNALNFILWCIDIHNFFWIYFHVTLLFLSVNRSLWCHASKNQKI